MNRVIIKWLGMTPLSSVFTAWCKSQEEALDYLLLEATEFKQTEC